MAEIWTDIWDWLGVEDNRARIAIIIAVLGLIGGFLGWVFGWFKRGAGGGGQTASGGSVNVGGNVGGDVTTGGRKGKDDDPS